MSDEEPKQRHITIDFHILAYLGDLMKVFEEGICNQAKEILKQQSNTQKRQEQTPDGR